MCDTSDCTWMKMRHLLKPPVGGASGGSGTQREEEQLRLQTSSEVPSLGRCKLLSHSCLPATLSLDRLAVNAHKWRGASLGLRQIGLQQQGITGTLDSLCLSEKRDGDFFFLTDLKGALCRLWGRNQKRKIFADCFFFMPIKLHKQTDFNTFSHGFTCIWRTLPPF